MLQIPVSLCSLLSKDGNKLGAQLNYEHSNFQTGTSEISLLAVLRFRANVEIDIFQCDQ